jgi:hypothetical protein
LLEVTRKGARGACHVGYRTASVQMCIACGNCAIERGVLYICLPRKPSGPNWLEEAYGRLHSVPCLLTLEVLGGRRAPGIRVTRLTGKDAQPLQSV